MAYNGFDTDILTNYFQPVSNEYDAKSDRTWFADIGSQGIVEEGHLAVTWSTGMVLAVAAGVAWVKGVSVADQGMYRARQATGSTVTVPAADATNPRIDTVICRVFDDTHDLSAMYKARVEVVPGTPTVGANLTNLSGKNPLTSLDDDSLNLIVLAYVLVGAGVTNLAADKVQDARTRVSIGGGGAAPPIGIPVGAVLDWPYASSDVPDDFILPYGQAISRTTYSELNALASSAGYPHGSGDGSTTFNVPDYRGRVGIGKDDMGGSAAGRVGTISSIVGTTLGSAGGLSTHTLATSEIPLHTHGVPAADGDIITANTARRSGTQATTIDTGTGSGGGGAHNNMQPGIIVNKIMRAN